MQGLKQTMAALGLAPQSHPSRERPDYKALMQQSIHRVRMAECGIREATSLEELDIARSSLLAAWAEVQQVVRAAKREQGVALRPITETEEMHRNLRDFLNGRINVMTAHQEHRKTGTRGQ